VGFLVPRCREWLYALNLVLFNPSSDFFLARVENPRLRALIAGLDRGLRRSTLVIRRPSWRVREPGGKWGVGGPRDESVALARKWGLSGS